MVVLRVVQVNASSFGLGDVMLLKSQGKHIAAAYSTLQELYRQQIIANSIPMPVIQRDKSETPISSDCDGDDTSEEPPPRTPPERPLSRGRSHQRDAFPRRGMRPVSADKNGVALLGSGAHGRTPHSPAQPRRRSRSLVRFSLLSINKLVVLATSLMCVKQWGPVIRFCSPTREQPVASAENGTRASQ